MSKTDHLFESEKAHILYSYLFIILCSLTIANPFQDEK